MCSSLQARSFGSAHSRIRPWSSVQISNGSDILWSGARRNPAFSTSRDRNEGVYNGLKTGNLYKSGNHPGKVAKTNGIAPMVDVSCPSFNPQFKTGKPYSALQKRKTLSDLMDHGLKKACTTINDGSRYFPTSIIETESPVYNPQMKTGGKPYTDMGMHKGSEVLGKGKNVYETPHVNNGERFPGSVIESPVYNAQLEAGQPYIVKRATPFSDVYRKQNCNQTINSGTRQPGSILTFKTATSKNIHPFEKPLSLCEWLIRTYSNEGMTVLDPTMGGGSSGVVCRKLGRNYIGIERNEEWFHVASKRIYSIPSFEPTILVEQFGD